jgi:hypothetical protein
MMPPACTADEFTLHAPVRPASADLDFGPGIPGFAIRYNEGGGGGEDLYAGLDERQRYELDRRCDYHPPQNLARAEAHQAWRRTIKAAMAEAMRSLPPGRETSQALSALDDALMYGNAAIARPPMSGGRKVGH